ncbi:MAG: hypothetical protein ABIE42_05885 [Candidatus Eisenbacteria bacterium]
MLSRLRSCGGVLLVLFVAAVANSGVVAQGTQELMGSYDSDYSATIWSPLVLALAHLPASDRYFPYAGVGFGWSFFSDSEGTESESTTVLPIVCGGSKILVTERAAVNIEVYYMHQENALYIEDLDASQFGITVGLSFLLGSQASSEPRETLWEKTERELAD